MNFSRKKLKVVSLTIIISLLISYINPAVFQSEAAGNSDDWIITDKDGYVVDSESISWTAWHHVGDVDNTRYRTMYYYMFLNEIDPYPAFDSSSAQRKLYVSSKSIGNIDPDGNQLYEYTISRTDFLAAATAAGLTGEMLFASGSDGYTVYLSPVYEAYKTKNGVDIVDADFTNVCGLNRMLSYDWSSTTKKLLPGTYNQRFTIKPKVYTMEVKLVTEDSPREYTSLAGANPVVNGKTDLSNSVDKVFYTKKLLATEAIDYTLPQKFQTLKKDKLAYKFDHIDYVYTDRKTGKEKRVENIRSDTLTDKAPDADPNTKMTVYMVFAEKPEAYTMEVRLVTEDSPREYTSLAGANPVVNGKVDTGNKVEKAVYTGKLMLENPIEYTLPQKYETLSKDKVTYTFDHMDYTYTDKKTEKQKWVENVSAGKLKEKAPDADPETGLIVYMVYRSKPYTYTIDAVDENHVFLRELMKTPQTTYAYQRVERKTYGFDTLASFTLNKAEYHYIKEWYLAYTDPDGKEKTINGEADHILIEKMPPAKEGSNAVFHLVYSTEKPPTPTPTTVPTITPEPSPAIPEEPIPEAKVITEPFTDVFSTGKLRADLRSGERFVATLGVPTTESLYGEVIATDYLLGYTLEKKVGRKDFIVNVSRKYILKYYDASPDKKPVTDTVAVTIPVSVPRAYGYWEITNLECYKINNAELHNYALDGGMTTIYPNYSYYDPPEIAYTHSSNEDAHVFGPEDIVLPDVVLTPAPGEETRRPAIPDCTEEFTYIALSQAGKAKVKSDFLSFNGNVIMSDKVAEWEAPDVDVSGMPQCYTQTDENVLYKPDNIIPATKDNGTYMTSGTITYSKVAKVGSYKGDYLSYPISGLNNVVIHTPVICSARMEADNDQYVQLISPHTDCLQLVLDPDPTLSDFMVHISNTGFHSGKQGYFTRNFSRSIRDPNVSYIAKANGLLMNQVRFPFDVYIDTGKAFDCSDDDFIKVGTWITIDRSTPRFYLPMTVNEGVYKVSFRTIAVNGLSYLNQTQAYANTQLTNYVATDSMKVEVSGRIYGLTVYDLTDYPMWEEVFRIPNSTHLKKDSADYPDGTSLSTYSSGRSYTYTTGTNDQYGKDTGRNIKYTFPLVNGSHPAYKNQGILKTGYGFRYCLETTGNMAGDLCKIRIKPTFYFVDKNGKNRKEVDLYYTESINNKTRHLVKVGSALDQINQKKVRVGDLCLGIPEWELKQTAALMGLTYAQLSWKYSRMFTYSDIRLNSDFRTLVGNKYLNRIKSYASYSDVLASGISEADILSRTQRWYGQFYLPDEVHVVAKDFDVMGYADKYGVDYTEDFWLKDGYIIINISIDTVTEDGSRRLSYINYPNYRDYGHCSMWLTENPPMKKTSYHGPTFNIYAGDFMIYYSSKRMTDDYKAGAIY